MGQKRHLTDSAPFPVYPDQQTLGSAFTRSPKGPEAEVPSWFLDVVA
jgi:hypothetical protein